MKQMPAFLTSISSVCLLSATVLAADSAPGSSVRTIIGTQGSSVMTEVRSELSGTAGDSGASSVAGVGRPATYGDKDFTALDLPMAAMTPMVDGVWLHAKEGWAHLQSGWSATCERVTLPSGASIEGITTWTNDTDATFSIQYVFYRTDMVNNTFADLFTWTSTAGTPGVEQVFTALSPGPHTVSNDRATYVLCIDHGTTGASLESAGATIWYRLQVSPAPAVASFSDVPTTHPFFQQIEALAASGISTGFTDGTFRPSANVTRMAMAAFLARALGLHFPDATNP